jgi:putative flippase GtrA
MIVYAKKMYKKYEEIINYLIVGVLTTVVSLSTYYLCVVTILDPHIAWQLQAANLISWICAVAFAYVTNRIFVFKSNNMNIFKEICSFTSSRVVTLLMDMFIMFMIVTVFNGNDKIGKLVTQVVVTIGNYILSKLFVFKEGKNG